MPLSLLIWISQRVLDDPPHYQSTHLSVRVDILIRNELLRIHVFQVPLETLAVEPLTQCLPLADVTVVCILRHKQKLVGYITFCRWVYRQLKHIEAETKWPPFRGTTLSNAFSGMKVLEFRLKFHWSLLQRVKSTMFQYWFRWWFGAVQATSHYLNQCCIVYWRIYASLDPNELSWLDKIKDLNYGEISMWKSMLVKGNFQACPLTGWQHIFVVHHISSPLDEMEAISHTTYSSAFSGMKSFVF